jgi:hypothetical protein
MPRKRTTTSDRAWPEKPAIRAVENVPISLDASAVADAITSQFRPSAPALQCEPCKRSSRDDRLILFLTAGIAILSVSSILCALISALVTAHSARTISKLHLLLQ